MDPNSDVAFYARINALRADRPTGPTSTTTTTTTTTTARILYHQRLFRDQTTYNMGSDAMAHTNMLLQQANLSDDCLQTMRARQRRRRLRQAREEEENSYNTHTDCWLCAGKEAAGGANDRSHTKSTMENDRDEALINRLDLVLKQNSELQALLVDQAGAKPHYYGNHELRHPKRQEHEKIRFSPSFSTMAKASSGSRAVHMHSNYVDNRNQYTPLQIMTMQREWLEPVSDNEKDDDDEEDEMPTKPVGPKGIDLSVKSTAEKFEEVLRS